MINQKTNLNVQSAHGNMQYLFELMPSHAVIEEDGLWAIDNADNVTFRIMNLNEPGVQPIIRNYSSWSIPSDTPEKLISNDYIPSNVKLSIIRIYFPEYSVETYCKNVKYAVSISTWVFDKKIILGEFLIDRNQALACPELRILQQNYNDYIDLPIIDPNSLFNNVDWNDFRKYVCGGRGSNNNGAVVHIDFTPVQWIRQDNIYISYDGFSCAHNAIQINLMDDKIFLRLAAQFKIQYIKDYWDRQILTPTIDVNLHYNKEFTNLRGDIDDYIRNNYNIEVEEIHYILVVSDEDDIYLYNDSMTDLYSDASHYVFGPDKLHFDNWLGWHEGQMIKTACVLSGKTLNDNGPCQLTVMGNPIPLTKDIMKYFVIENPGEINSINIEKLKDMKIYKIDAVNKVVNEVISIARPDDVKANLITPLFYAVQDATGINVLTEVTSRICINLDQFKSKVKIFSIKIEGVTFTEEGRTNAGVIFKIVGNMLPKKVDAGIYYILNEHQELVTKGNYKYIS